MGVPGIYARLHRYLDNCFTTQKPKGNWVAKDVLRLEHCTRSLPLSDGQYQLPNGQSPRDVVMDVYEFSFASMMVLLYV